MSYIDEMTGDELRQSLEEAIAQRDALLKASEKALRTLSKALAAACDDEETRDHVLENHPALVQLRTAIAKARGES
jgi:hypothetical protein